MCLAGVAVAQDDGNVTGVVAVPLLVAFGNWDAAPFTPPNSFVMLGLS